MRGSIYYYSSTGNTELACEAIVASLPAVDFQLVDVTQQTGPAQVDGDLIGFATWADYWNPPQRMKTFMEEMLSSSGVPAFVFNTFGAMSWRTLATLQQWAEAKGFHVAAGHSLHTPQSFLPLIKRGQGFEKAPNAKELAAFSSFTTRLAGVAETLAAGGDVPTLRPGMMRFLPAFSRTHSRGVMGEKYVDETACIECGTCRDRCPYGAIGLSPKPVFDQSRCYGCWACYSHCPTNAIYTKKIRGVPQYAKPNDALLAKLTD